LPSSEPRSLPPPPFAFDHPPQSLTARWAAKLLARAAAGECKPLFASRTLAAKKIRNHALGTGPRRPAPGRCRRIPARQGALPGLERPADVRRSDIDTAGFEPVVFAAHSGSVDIAGWRIFAAIAERRPGIRDCNIGLGGGWDEKASHIP